ncbi:MAG: HEAT repeat domain-containing protein [Thermodesulfovibrionia bacterium]|nr:HEAT repeat domain-containing protein [Thermodesulfovibrionia bacterium]
MKIKFIVFIILSVFLSVPLSAEIKSNSLKSDTTDTAQSGQQLKDGESLQIPETTVSVQMGVYLARKNAEEIVAELKKSKIDCRIQDGTKIFTVYCGNFKRHRDTEAVGALKNKLISRGYKDVFLVLLNETPVNSEQKKPPEEQPPVQREPVQEPAVRHDAPAIVPPSPVPAQKKPVTMPLETQPEQQDKFSIEKMPGQLLSHLRATRFDPKLKFLLIISLTFALISFVFFLAVIFLRRIGAKKSTKADRLAKKHRDILKFLSEEYTTSTEEIVKRLKSIGDDTIIEVFLDKAGSLTAKPVHHFQELYDASGITERYLSILEHSKSWKKRAFAANKLGQIGSVKSVPLLFKIIRNVKDEDEGVRNAALRALGRIRDKRAVPFLIEALGYPETWLPPRVGEILVSIGEEAIEPLIKELKNYQSETRRQWAAEILGWLEAKSATMHLIDALFDISPEVRAKSVGALGKIRDNRAVSKLTELLISDPVPFVRVRVAKALGEIGHPSVIDYLINVLKDPEWWVRVRAVEALEQMGDKAVPALLIALEDDDKEVRRCSAMALERIGYVETLLNEYGNEEYKPEIKNILFLVACAGVIESISEKLTKSTGILQKRIARLLGEAETKEAAGPLLELLTQTTDWKLKSRIIESLAKIGAKGAVPCLIESLKDNEYWVRRSAVEALGMLNAVDNADEIAEMLEDPNPLARESALRALSALKITKHREKIESLLLDPSPKVRSIALYTIRILGLKTDINKIIELLKDTAEDVRIETLRYFSSRADRGVLSDVLQFLLYGSDELRREVVEYVRKVKPEGFNAILNSFTAAEFSNEALSSLMEITSIIGDKEAYQFIYKFTQSTDPFLRGKAFSEISKFGIESNEEIFEKALFDPSRQIRITVLIGIGIHSAKNLLEKAKTLRSDPDEHVRLALALAFGVSGLTEFKRDIIDMLEDPSQKVVAGACMSLAIYDDPFLLTLFQAKQNIKEIKDEVKRIEEDERFASVVEIIRTSAQKSSNLEIDLLLAKNEKDFARHLIKVLKEALYPEIRVKAIELFNIIGTAEFLPSLLGVMKKDPSAEVRMRAMEVVARVGRENESISALSSMLVDPTQKVRIRAAELLGGYRQANALEALLHTLDTSDRPFREAVTTSLSYMLTGEPEKIDELVKSVPETKTRKLGMAWLMGKTRKQGAKTFLLNLLSDNDPDVRASAIGALGKFKDEELIEILERLIYDTNERVRAAAVNAVVAIGGPRVFEIVKTALEDIDKYVRIRAAIGLAKLEPQSAVDILQRKLLKFPELSSCLKGILYTSGFDYDQTIHEDTLAKNIVDELCQAEEMFYVLKSSPDKEKRLHAFRILTLTNSNDINGLLLVALKDPSPEIREEAEKYSQH